MKRYNRCFGAGLIIFAIMIMGGSPSSYAYGEKEVGPPHVLQEHADPSVGQKGKQALGSELTETRQQSIIHRCGLHLDWEMVYGGPEDDFGTQAIEAPEGGFLVMGTTRSQGAGATDLWLLKVNGSGKVLWNKTYGGPRRDYGHQILASPDSGYLIAGIKEEPEGAKAMWLIKVDQEGNKLWERIIQSSKYDGGPHAAASPDGGYMIAGTIWNDHTDSWDVWLAKVDARGKLLWERSYGGTMAEWGTDILPTNDKGYDILVTEEYTKTSPFRIRLLKVDGEGKTIWEQAYANPSSGKSCYYTGNRILGSSDGGCLILGNANDSHILDDNALLLRLDENGQVLWKHVYGYSNRRKDNVDAGIILENTNYLIVGSVWSSNYHSWDMWLFEVDQNGTHQHWEQKYGGRGEDNGNHVLLLHGGGLVVTGSTRSQGEGGSDLWILKFSLGE